MKSKYFDFAAKELRIAWDENCKHLWNNPSIIMTFGGHVIPRARNECTHFHKSRVNTKTCSIKRFILINESVQNRAENYLCRIENRLRINRPDSIFCGIEATAHNLLQCNWSGLTSGFGLFSFTIRGGALRHHRGHPKGALRRYGVS